MAANVENGVQIFIKKDDETVGYPITSGDSIVDLDKNTDFSAVKTTVNTLNSTVSSHTSNKSNPHGVTKAQVGLGNVENKSSATIRGELTSANVTTALGYTPPRTDTNTWRDVVDNLTSTDTTKSLSANQGSVLKGLVDGKAASNHTHSQYITGITSAMVTTALGYTPAASDTKYSDFTGASASAAGTHGLVPAPAQGGQSLFLRGDGTWATPTDTKYSLSSFGITASATELNYTKGVTSAIQTQLNGKAASNHTHSNYLTGITKDMITTALGYTPPQQDTNTWRDVVDNLTSTATDKSLSANQGKVLKGLVDGKADASHTHSGYLATSSVVNNLTSTSTTAPLSAYQGKLLNDNKAASNHTHSNYLLTSNVVNNLTSTSTSSALSAYQGKLLNDNKLATSSVVNNLTSTSTTAPLSANQGKVLKGLVDNLQSSLTSTSSVILKQKELIKTKIDSLSNTEPNTIYYIYNTTVSSFPNKNGVMQSNTTLLRNAILLNLGYRQFLMNFPIGNVSNNRSAEIPEFYFNHNGSSSTSFGSGKWISTNPNTDWINITTFKNNTQNYNSSNVVKAREMNGVVYVVGALKNTTVLGSAGSYDTIDLFDIPSSISTPTYNQYIVCQGSGMNKFVLGLTAKSNTVTLQRYGTTSAIQVPANSWLPFSITYVP